MLAPTAGAFASPREEVRLAYDASAMPFLAAAGSFDVEGRFQGGMLSALHDGTRFARVPTLTLASLDASGFRNETFRDATLVLHEGGAFGVFPDATLEGTLHARFGLLSLLPGHDDGEEEGDSPPEEGPTSTPILLVADEMTGALTLSPHGVDLYPFDALVSVLGADGEPVDGWSRVRLNEGQGPGGAEEGNGTLVRMEGGAEVAWNARVLASAPAPDATLVLRVTPADDPSLERLLSVASDAGSTFGGGEGASDGTEGLRGLEPLAGVLNGGVILFHPPQGEGGPLLAPKEARRGASPFETGAVTVLRGGDVALSWAGGDFVVQGTPDLAITQQGLAVDAPATVGLVPVLAIALWLAAAGAIALHFLRKRETVAAPKPARWAALGVHLAALVVSLLVWDALFAATFGTSAGRALSGGFSQERMPFVAGTLALELLPWIAALLLFALPVRIAAGVALRQVLGQKGHKGFAKALGLAALVVFGNLYALWMLNVPIQFALRFVPTLGG